MEKKEIIVITAVLLVVIVTVALTFYNIRQKVLYSPGELLPPIETIDIENEFCFDSDIGLNYFEKGAVLWGQGDGGFHTSEDYCTSDSVWPEGTLFEMFCVGNSFSIKDIECPNGCEEGICLD